MQIHFCTHYIIHWERYILGIKEALFLFTFMCKHKHMYKVTFFVCLSCSKVCKGISLLQKITHNCGVVYKHIPFCIIHTWDQCRHISWWQHTKDNMTQNVHLMNLKTHRLDRSRILTMKTDMHQTCRKERGTSIPYRKIYVC